MAAGISSEKIDLLIYGPTKPIVEKGFSDQFVLHSFESQADLERMTSAVKERIRGIATTGPVVANETVLSGFPKLEIVSSFGVGYDHINAGYARDHGIVVCNTPDVLTEEVADVALGLFIATAREFVKADRYLRSGLWTSAQGFPLSVGSLRDRKVGMIGMGRIGQAIARRLDASLVPVVYHSRNPAAGVSHQHFPNLIEMAKAVDTLIIITPGGASTAKLVNAEVLKALGPRGIVINVARGSVVDEPALIAALKSGTILAAGLDVFANEPNVPEELRAMQNVVLLPHIGSGSVVTRNAMDQLVVDNLKAWFAGKAPLTPIPETPVKGR
jgi:lactate dehydrogenase-like 2-hydroxyacid dehydrogenase